MKFTQIMTPNSAWNKFKLKFNTILDKHAPTKTFSSRRDRQPWVTTEYLEGTNERDNKASTASQTLAPEDKAEYRRTRNRVTALKRELKHLYFQTSIEKSHGDSGKLWKILKRF